MRECDISFKVVIVFQNCLRINTKVFFGNLNLACVECRVARGIGSPGASTPGTSERPPIRGPFLCSLPRFIISVALANVLPASSDAGLLSTSEDLIMSVPLIYVIAAAQIPSCAVWYRVD